MNFSSCFLALPESIISLANLTPSSIESAFPATYKAAAEFKTTAFLLGPFWPFKIDNVISAFSLGFPPTRSSLEPVSYTHLTLPTILLV